MTGRRPFLPLLLCAGVVVAACGEDREEGLPTTPSFATKSACNATTVDKAIRATFTDNTLRQLMQTTAQNMTSAFAGGDLSNSTLYGFQIMQKIETDGRVQGGPQPSSDLTVALFPCMKLASSNNAVFPASVVTELTSGAYGVRGRTASDADAVLSQDGDWIIEPPGTKKWNDITTLDDRGLSGDAAHLFLALGRSAATAGFTATQDELLSPADDGFDWSTIPSATFGSPYVVVGQCSVEDGFLQHNPFKTTNSQAEIFGFVQPVQCPPAPLQPTLIQQLFQAIGPEPAYATSALVTRGTGGAAKPALSPFVIMNPRHVNTPKFSLWPSIKGNVTNRRLSPTPTLNPVSEGGVPFKQASVLAYLREIVNNGTPGQICYNWAYNDENGVTDFLYARITKAGGFQLFATNAGTLAAPKATGQPVPSVPAGATALSPAFQIKNDNSTLSPCPSFDGTTYFTNILDPSATRIPFDPQDPSTFPPNYDVPGTPQPPL